MQEMIPRTSIFYLTSYYSFHTEHIGDNKAMIVHCNVTNTQMEEESGFKLHTTQPLLWVGQQWECIFGFVLRML